MDLFGGGGMEAEEAFQTRTRSGSQMRLTHRPAQKTLEIVIVSGKRDELRVNDEADPVDKVTLQVVGPSAAELWEKLRLMPW